MRASQVQRIVLGVSLCAFLGIATRAGLADESVAPSERELAVEAGASAGSLELAGGEGSLAQPPALPATGRADGYRSRIEAAWFSGGSDLSSRGRKARVQALHLGASNYEAAARALIAAPAEDDLRLERATLAVQLAPDLPMARMALASAYLDAGQFFDALEQAVAGFAAIPRNLEASVWLAASLLSMFAAVLVVGSLGFIVCVGVKSYSHAAHDVGDLVSKEMPDFARAALLGAILLVPILLGEALLGVVLGLLALGFVYGDARVRRALALAAVLLVLGLYPVTRIAGMALTALDSDPVATAAHAVVRGMESPGEVETLRRAEGEDLLAEAALALRERRNGDVEAALARYTRLIEKTPADPAALGALSNMYFERGDDEQAVALAERATGLVRSATLLFNLSQIYARSFRMDEFESAMAQAQLTNARLAADLSHNAEPDFVADLPFALAPIRQRMIEGAAGDAFVDPVRRALMPGRLGESWVATSGGLGLAMFLSLMVAGRWERSSRCERCGARICNRCDGVVWNSEICDSCHHLFHRPESTDARLRMARLAELRKRDVRVGRASIAASLLLPGVGGLLASRPDLSFLGLFFFAWGAALILWRDGVVADPLAVGAAGPLAFLVAGSLAVFAYALVVVRSVRIQRSR